MRNSNIIGQKTSVNITLTQVVVIVVFLLSLFLGGIKYLIQEKNEDLNRLILNQSHDHEDVLELKDEIHELKTLINFRLDRLEKRIDK